MRLKKEKCRFMLPEVEYLGHCISAKGLHPTDEKVRAIKSAPAPHNVSQLKSFLGLINYYAKFLPSLSTTLAPLNQLLQKNARWTWGQAQKKAFHDAKTQLTASSLLVHFDPKKELVLACDASPYGVGAVLSHRMADGEEEKPIAFASRSLSAAEKRYAQLDKEALAIVFGVKRFHQFLFGRHFEIISDHKPLQHLFGELRAVPPMASACIQRWALTLGAYDYTIVHRPGKEHANADLLSRLPLPESPEEVPLPGETVLLMECLQSTPATAQHIKAWTNKDRVLARVRNLVLRGWPDSVTDGELQPYHRRRDELSVQDGCVLWGSRVIVPRPGQSVVLEELHQCHPGIVRMKALARSFVWWPGIDSDLEQKVRACSTCQDHQKSPAAAPLHPWEWPETPWSRIHADYAGPFMGRMFLIVVDAYSKWLEAVPVNSATSQTTIEKMRIMFATHGLPQTVVTDNGSVFTSKEFEEFAKRNGVRHVTSAPYHPATNGLAERAVQTFKNGMKKLTSGSIDSKVSRFLFTYRITPHSTTGVSPTQLLMGRRPRSVLDQLHPDMARRVQNSQQRQKRNHDQHVKPRAFAVGNTVSVRNFGSGATWLVGAVEKALGPLSYQIKLEDGRLVRRHVDHLRARVSTTEMSAESSEEDFLADTISVPPTVVPVSETDESAVPAPESEPRHSTRNRQSPDRLA